MDSNDATSRQWYSLLLRRTGRLEAAMEQARAALELDPTSPVINSNLAATYMMLGYDEKALSYRQTAVDLGLDVGRTDGEVELIAALRAGDAEKFRQLLEQRQSEDGPSDAFIDAIVAVSEDRSRWPELEAAMEADGLPDEGRFGLNLFLGRPAKALEIALALPEPEVVDLSTMWLPEAAAMRRLPGFAELADRLGLLDYWKQYGWPDDCRPAADGIQCGFASLAARL